MSSALGGATDIARSRSSIAFSNDSAGESGTLETEASERAAASSCPARNRSARAFSALIFGQPSMADEAEMAAAT